LNADYIIKPGGSRVWTRTHINNSAHWIVLAEDSNGFVQAAGFRFQTVRTACSKPLTRGRVREL